MDTAGETMQCRLLGGPFDATECDDLLGTVTIRMRAGPGEHYAVYQRLALEELAADGRTIFHFESLIEESAS